MIYIETGTMDVYYNFATEYYFTVEKKLDDTIFLFWRTTPTLMVGKFQNTLEEIDVAYVKKKNIRLVRRLSGGGTIYTDPGGWQFTFIQNTADQQIQFLQYMEPIIHALQKLGVPAEINGRNDMTIDGKKFSGNAQYQLGNRLVHHGSLLFDTNIEQMVASTTVDIEKIQSKSIKSVRDRVTNISWHLKGKMTPEEFKTFMITNILKDPQKQYTITPEDDARIRQIADEKFNNWEHIFGSDPAFQIIRSGRLPGGRIQFKLNVKKGIIREAALYGDFFSTMDAEKICDTLTGCRYTYNDILAALRQGNVEGAVYQISTEDMAHVIAENYE